MQKFRNVTVIGLGLLGGSICKALKAMDRTTRIAAYGRDGRKLEPALRDGAVDSTGPIADMDLKESDLVIVSIPVIASMRLIEEILERKDLRGDALVVDVGSVKAPVVDAAAAHARAPQFIGCHPMAGSEKTGYEHSTGKLYENASVIVTPHAGNERNDIERVIQFWKSLGAAVTVTNAEFHDRVVAYTSHLPHIAAGSLVAVLREFMDGGSSLSEIESFIGNGFRDTTRIASGSPEMWLDILLGNSDNIDAALAELIRRLEEVRSSLGDGDRIRRHLMDAKMFRDGLR